MPMPKEIKPKQNLTDHPDALGDFRTDGRVLLLSCLAVPVGLIGACVAKALLWLIAVITNLFFFHCISARPSLPEQNHLGLWLPVIPVIGALIIGMVARFGSEK
ncbi:MAG TPA: hypothetical protein VGV18_03085, partial [Verrucomicrobiae bacterium]|nr:hypothetical protein [Verrucomicrobiae bacterium]